MKMYRIAEGVPPGYIEVEVTLNNDGTGSAKVTGHGPDAGCKKANHKKLIADTFAKPVDGFYGPLVPEDASGLTPEGQAELSSPATALKEDEEPFKATRPRSPLKQKQREMDTGMGV